jgi:hypothetical protein
LAWVAACWAAATQGILKLKKQKAHSDLKWQHELNGPSSRKNGPKKLFFFLNFFYRFLALWACSRCTTCKSLALKLHLNTSISSIFQGNTLFHKTCCELRAKVREENSLRRFHIFIGAKPRPPGRSSANLESPEASMNVWQWWALKRVPKGWCSADYLFGILLINLYSADQSADLFLLSFHFH